MASVLSPERDPARTTPDPAPPRSRRATPRWVWALVVVAVWLLVWLFTRGSDTLTLPASTLTDLHTSLNGFRDAIITGRDSNPVIAFTYGLGAAFTAAVTWLQELVSIPAFPRPVPQVGWLGVAAAAAWTGYLVAGWRISLLVAGSFVCFGLFGFWSDAVDLLIVTFVAVAVAGAVGMVLAVLIASSRTADRVLTLLMDLLQTMPTFVYLLPIVLFFGIGASAAVVSTLLYALPPIVRIAGHGIRSVSPTTIEATDSAGQTWGQRMLKVQLPMARKTIIVGLNQTIMSALSMATIASFVNGPGLGKPVLNALERNDVGGAFVPGALIVVAAVMLDRTTTAASERGELVARGLSGDPRLRRGALVGGGILVLALLYVSRTYTWAATFPETSLGTGLAAVVDSVFTWVLDTFGGVTTAVKNVVSTWLIDPLQALLSDSPWWLAAVAILALAYVFGRTRTLLPTVLCLAGIRLLDLWNDAMVTLAMVLVATLVVMLLAVVFGVWMARSRRADLGLRPLLDAGQTIPPFVYLIPVLALFGPTRFTAIVAAVVYAAPAAIKLVADGVKAVSPTTLEAARSTGSTTWQEITKVQLPMARGSLVLAANQGLLFVLAMVVIGGLVGAGALGYDVVFGFSRTEQWGKGLAAGLTIVLMGVMIDRITRAAAAVRSAD